MHKYGYNEHGFANFELKDETWLDKHFTEIFNWIKPFEFQKKEIKDYGESLIINLYSYKNIYHIAACHPREFNDHGYLGLSYSKIENFSGTHLSEGDYNQSTWDQMLADILNCEVEKL